MDPKFISVILPTYNERENIAPLIKAIHDQMGPCAHEIIVVDDNSPDGTYEAARNLKDGGVKVIRRESDHGLARSIARGLKEAGGNIILLMDSDFDHDPRYIPLMIEAISRYDCVCASRFLPGGRMNGWGRALGSWLFNLFVRVMTRSPLTDHLYGFIMIQREVLERSPYDRIFFGYGDYYIRLLYYLQKNKAAIFQFSAVNGGRVRKKKLTVFEIFRQYFISVCNLSHVDETYV